MYPLSSYSFRITMKALPGATLLLVVIIVYCGDLVFPKTRCLADQRDNLNKLLKSRRSRNPPLSFSWDEEEVLIGNVNSSPVYIGPQQGLMEADKIGALPGQPEGGVDFDHYAGYVTVDPTAGKALFYYFAESPQNTSDKPLVLWLNGGPGCSSFGGGAMEELGPLHVKSDGKTLFRNHYAWNEVANILFLESPAGVGFSYSNSSLKGTGDKSTAADSYTFLINWLKRFPNYKSRDFYIAGESYAGHYVPQLAHTILSRNKNNHPNHNATTINLKGIAIGNAWIDDDLCFQGQYNYLWTHGLNSDETHAGIRKYCDLHKGNISDKCSEYIGRSNEEMGDIDIYNIYAPNCNLPGTAKSSSSTTGRVNGFDPRIGEYTRSYLNLEEVQRILRVRNTTWKQCSGNEWNDSPTTVLPIIKKLIADGLRTWLYSGDVDGMVPITATRYSINNLKLPLKNAWRPWYSKNEVGGYVVEYKGLVLATVRGAGHMVPQDQPERALTMISSFLNGTLPPSKQNNLL